MPSGVTLLDMATDLRATLGYSLNILHGVDQQPALYAALRRTQIELWQMHDWPAFYLEVDVPVPVAGSGVSPMVPCPVEIDFNHINEVWWRASGERDRRAPLDYGIYAAERSESDYATSVDDVGTPSRWAFDAASAGAGADVIELWPAPASAGVATFGGRQALLPLVAEDDVCTLDSELIIAQAAVPIMMRNKDPTAQVQLSKAQQLFNRMKARQGGVKRKPFVVISRI